MKRRVIGILAFVMITLLAFAVACGSTDSDDELTEEKKYDYIQLPPEMTSWSEEKDDGTSVSYAGHPIITNTAVTQLTNRDEITTRYIMIQDLNKQASLNPNTFVPVIMDEVRVSRTTVITFPNGPYASVKIEGESDLNEFPSKYFYDKNHNLSSGYNHYIAGNISDPITNLVPTVKFSWG